MLESIFHHRTDSKPFNGEIISLEGDIYIARLKDAEGNIVQSCDHHFPCMVNARHWLKRKGVSDIEFHQSTAYFEMINN